MKYYKRIRGNNDTKIILNHIYEIDEIRIGDVFLIINNKYYDKNYFQEVTKLDYDVYDYTIRLINYHINSKLELNDLNVRKYIQYVPTTTYDEWCNLLPDGGLEDKLKFVFEKIKEYNSIIPNKNIEKTITTNEITIDLIEQILYDKFDRDDIQEIVNVLKEELSKKDININKSKKENPFNHSLTSRGAVSSSYRSPFLDELNKINKFNGF